MARRGEITSKSPENLSDHFLNSAFARLAYYFYGCWGGREERAFVPRSGREGEGNAGRSISNMLINDPFERWIGGVGVPTVSFYPFVRQAFECQKEWFRCFNHPRFNHWEKSQASAFSALKYSKWSRKYLLEETRRTRRDSLESIEFNGFSFGYYIVHPLSSKMRGCYLWTFEFSRASEWTWWYSWNNC